MAFSMTIVRTAAAVDEALDRAARELAGLDDAVKIEARTRKVELSTSSHLRELFNDVYALRARLASLVKQSLEEGA